MGYEYILEEKKDGIYIIYLNRPEVRNALGMEMRMELLHAFEQAEHDDETKCIILTGQGKAFSAGGDLSALKEMNSISGRKRMQKSHPLLLKMLEMEKPIIAAVNGAAAGAGFSLAVLCDLVLASDQAFFVQSFVNVGLIPDFAAIHFLPLLIGPQKAKELMFMGERISAHEAYQLGLVNRVIPSDSLLEKAMERAEKLARKSPISIGMTKKIMHQHLNAQLKLLLELEAQGQGICYETEDFKEGISAFFEKREPIFIGK